MLHPKTIAGYLLPVLFVVFAFPLAGCRREEVTRYEIRGAHSPQNATPTGMAGMPGMPGMPSAGSGPHRMMVGFIQRDEGTWFIKIFGAGEQVDAVADEFKTYLQSIQVEDNQPIGKIPATWKEAPPSSGFVSKQYQINSADPPLMLKISTPYSQQDQLSNVNRWLGQQLGRERVEDASKVLADLKYQNGTMWLFDQRSAEGDESDVASEAANQSSHANLPAGHPPTTGNPLADMMRGTVGSSVEYDTPSGWRAIPDAPVVEAKLINESDEKLQINVTKMGKEFNQWDKHVLQWSADLSAEVDDQFADKNTERVTIDGRPSKLIRIDGQSDSIVGVLVATMDACYFVKMKGPTDSVAANVDAFRGFLNSLRLDGASDGAEESGEDNTESDAETSDEP